MKQLKRAIAGAALLALSGAASALTFNFTFLAGTSAQAQQAFIDAERAGRRCTATTSRWTFDFTSSTHGARPAWNGPDHAVVGLLQHRGAAGGRC